MKRQEKITTEKKEEGEIWKDFQQGCEVSFTWLHQKYYPDLYYYALKITGTEDLAKNVIQELFLYLWKNKDKLGEVTHIKQYLLFSLRRHAIRLVQKEKKQLHLVANGQQDIPGFIFSSEDVVIIKETEVLNEEKVVKALNQLSPRQREVIYLRYFDGLTNEEIAQVMSLNYQSVLNCLGRALTNLKKHILTQKSTEVTLVAFVHVILFF